MDGNKKEITIYFQEDTYHNKHPLSVLSTKNEICLSKYYDIHMLYSTGHTQKTILYLVVIFNHNNKEKYGWYLYRTDKIPPIIEGSHLDYRERLPKESINIVKRLFIEGCV